MLKVLQIKLQVWDKRIFDPLNYGMRKLDTISNFSRSQAILDQLGQVTEIFVCIHNPSERERERENDTLTSAGFLQLTSCFANSSAKQALYLLAINDLTGLLLLCQGVESCLWGCVES